MRTVTPFSLPWLDMAAREVPFRTALFWRRPARPCGCDRKYCNKPLAERTVCEAALLTGLSAGQISNNTIGNPAHAKECQQEVLNDMAKLGLVGEADIADCAREP